MASPSDIVRQQIHSGDRIGGRFEIERFVGAGAYGAIFSAIDVETMERVAVKALPPATNTSNKTAVGRFEREMKVISRLRHPNIITLYDFGTTPSGIVYMVIEFVDGVTLYDLVTTTQLSDVDALSICSQIAMALHEAHEKGVVHRDLKPQNVMVIRRPQGGYVAKVLDFGMAKLTPQGSDESVAQLTREGMAVGTPRYIAPEQARGKDVGAWSDIYALGLLFYEMFTGERAVKADTIESAIIAHVSPEPLNLEEIDRVPEYVRPVLYKMIEKKVARRYQSAGDVVRALQELERQHLQIDVAKTVPVGSRGIHASEHIPPAPGHVSSLKSAQELELDYQRYDQFAPAQRFQAPRKVAGIREAKSDFRPPQNIFEWIESIAAFVIYPVAFILLTAQMEGLPTLLRWAVGLVPLVAATTVPFTTNSPSWNLSMFRVLFGTSLLWIILAHAFGPERLGASLLRNPAWFLRPFSDAPLLGTLYDLVAAFSRAYGQILA
ncbi:MAG: serine/threonine-protein kinase [bacterium]